MAVVKGISLNTINSLKDEITFVAWKGLLVARKKRTKGWNNRPPAVLAWNERMKICNKVLKLFKPSIVDAYKYWANGSDFTWKDQYTSQFLGRWKTEGQMPMVVTSLTHTLIGGTLTLTFTFAAQKAVEGEGYGTLPYGSSPWGSIPDLYTDEGSKTPLKYEFAFGPPLSRPLQKFYGSPAKEDGCYFPPPADANDSAQYDPETPASKTIPISLLTKKRKAGVSPFEISCFISDRNAYNLYLAFEPVSTGGAAHSELFHETETSFDFWQTNYSSRQSNWGAAVFTTISKDEYLLIDEAFIKTPWSASQGNRPWRMRLHWKSVTRELIPPVTPTKIPPPQEYTESQEVRIDQNDAKALTFCPNEGSKRDRLSTVQSIEVTFMPLYPNGTISTTEVPETPFIVFLRDIDNNVPILCPPLLVT